MIARTRDTARRLWEALFVPSRPARYAGIWLLADLPLSVAIAWLLSRIAGVSDPTFPGVSWTRIVLVMCVMVPLIETAVLAVVIEGLRLMLRSVIAIALASAVLAALLHSLATPLWGFAIAWTFFLQAVCYQTWRQRSWLAAFSFTAALHALHNLYPALQLGLERLAAQPLNG